MPKHYRRTMKCPLGKVKLLLLITTSLSICSSNSAAQQGASAVQSDTPGAAVSGETQADATSPAAIPVSQPPAPQGSGKANPNQGTSKDRLFFTLPDFLTVKDVGQVPPLTTAQKFRVTARSSFDPVIFFWYGALAGLSQAENSEAGYKQGFAGYGKRYGAYFADGTLENFMTAAILPSLLNQDPRYFQLGEGGFWHRTGYAISRIFVTRTDSGHTQVNLSELLGSAIAAGISTYSYHPRGDRTLPNTLSVWGTQVGYDTLTIVVKEFWPDIRRMLHHSKAAQKP
jgi:hypothetical protein